MEPNRINHILAVANKMRKNAERFGVSPDDAYLVGYLHDVGYEYNCLAHNKSGGSILEKNGLNTGKKYITTETPILHINLPCLIY